MEDDGVRSNCILKVEKGRKWNDCPSDIEIELSSEGKVMCRN